MGVFDRQIASAKRMIAKYGEPCTWYSQPDSVGGRPGKPTAAAAVPHDVVMVFLPIDKEYLDTYLSKQPGQEATGLVQAFMGQVDFTPGLKDSVHRTINGEVLQVVDDNGIEVIDPNGEGVILYTVRLTR